MTPAEAVEYILGVGGVPVLAHPHVVDNVESLLPELAEAGLAGLEVYYKEYTRAEVEAFGAMAARYGLLPCGGSDYHAFSTPGEEKPGISGPPLEIVDRLRALAAEVSASRSVTLCRLCHELRVRASSHGRPGQSPRLAGTGVRVTRPLQPPPHRLKI